MKTFIVLKNGFRFQGDVISETDTELVLDEVKLGKTTVNKSAIIARSSGLK